MFEKKSSQSGTNKKTVIIIVSGLAVGIITAILAGQFVFDSVFAILHPDTSDFWQNLVTLAIATVLTLITAGLAFGVVSGVFYVLIYGIRVGIKQ